KEPRIDRGQFVNLLHAEATGQREADVVEPVRCWGHQLLGDELRIELFATKGFAGFEAANALPEGFLERASDGHDFADALHLSAQGGVGAGECLEGPRGNFRDYVVNG